MEDELDSSVEQQRTDAVIAALRRKIFTDHTIERSLRTELGTEKLLALALNALVQHSKETLLLMEATKLLAARTVEEKKAREAS